MTRFGMASTFNLLPAVRACDSDDDLLDAADKVRVALDPASREEDRSVALFELRMKASQWLQQGKPPGGIERLCFHWSLEFPEAFAGGSGLVTMPSG